MAAAAVLLIVSAADFPIFEKRYASISSQSELVKNQRDYILYSALDMVDNELPLSNENQFAEVDSFREWRISAFVTPGQTKFILMHRNEYQEGIAAFFKEVHMHYVKVTINPFYNIGAPLTSPSFARAVARSAYKYLESGRRGNII